MRGVLDDVPISIPLSILGEALPGCVLEVLLEAFMHSVRLALVEVDDGGCQSLLHTYNHVPIYTVTTYPPLITL